MGRDCELSHRDYKTSLRPSLDARFKGEENTFRLFSGLVDKPLHPELNLMTQ